MSSPTHSFNPFAPTPTRFEARIPSGLAVIDATDYLSSGGERELRVSFHGHHKAFRLPCARSPVSRASTRRPSTRRSIGGRWRAATCSWRKSIR